jgi:hypothetical protein
MLIIIKFPRILINLAKRVDNIKMDLENLECIHLVQVYPEAFSCEYVKTSSVSIKGKHI